MVLGRLAQADSSAAGEHCKASPRMDMEMAMATADLDSRHLLMVHKQDLEAVVDKGRYKQVGIVVNRMGQRVGKLD